MGSASGESRDHEAFLNAFAADIGALGYARMALLSHPVLHIGLDNIEPAICRLFIVRVVDLVEDGLLRVWGDRPQFDDYFSGRYQRNPHERIESLVARFHAVGIEVNPDDVADFLGLRYLRNMIVHGRLKDHEEKESYLLQRQLPTNPARCGLDLLERATRTCARLAEHIGRYGILLPDALRCDGSVWPSLVSMSDALLALSLSRDTRGWVRHLLRPSQLPRAWLRNVKSLDAWLTTTEVEPGLEVEPALFCEAIDIGLESWRELATAVGLPRDRVQDDTRILAELHGRRLYSKAQLGIDLSALASQPDALPERVRTALREAREGGWRPRGQLWDEGVPDGLGIAILRVAMPDASPVSPEALLQVLRDGAKTHRWIPDDTPARLFPRLLSRTGARQAELSAAAKEASELVNLSRGWYRFVKAVHGVSLRDPGVPP